jgi:predicted PurR-regulated permease PerM
MKQDSAVQRAELPGSHVGNSLERADTVAAERAAMVWSRSAQAAVIGMFLLLFVGCLIYARAILLPVVCAIVIGTMLGPLERRAIDWRIPSWLFALAVVLFVIGAVQFATILLSGSVLEWIKHAPEITEALKGRLQGLDTRLAAFRSIQEAVSQSPVDPLHIDIAGIVQTTLGFLTPAMGEVLIFLTTLFFFLFSRKNLRRSLILFFHEQDMRLRVIRILNDIEQDLTRYIGTVTVINAGIGLIAGFGAYLLGLPNAALISALAFACNFVPYIGPAFVVLVLFGVGLIHYPLLGQALIPPLLFVGLTTVEGHVVTPSIVGRSLTLNPFAVFLGLTFWTWLWGPVGAFLSVPFLIIGLVVINHLERNQEIDLPG